MNLPYFYESSIEATHHNLSKETSKYCIQVLRMKEGEQLQLTDGKGNLFTAVITKADKKNCEVNIVKTTNHKPQTANISIAISILKNPVRLEWFMEKATEIGVHEIFPIICEHTEKENFRFERMNNILVSAMLQSKQCFLPQLHQPKKYADFINENFNAVKLIAHCAENYKQSINQLHIHDNNVLILIGPEGDFSETEINTALRKSFLSVSLGNTRLRSETAGIVAAVQLCGLSFK